MVRRLVEEEQVGVRDDEAGERRACLLAARQRGWRLRPLVPREAETAQRGVDALVEGVAAEDLVLVLECGVARVGDLAVALVRGECLGHPVEVGRAGPHRVPQVRCGHERLVEMRLLGEQPDRQATLAMDLAEIGLVATSGEAEQRRLAGTVRTDEADPVADGDRRVDRVEDDEGADFAGHPREPQDAHRAAAPGGDRRRVASVAGAGPATDALAAARRVAAARFVRSVRASLAARSASPGVSPTVPSPASSVQRPPVRRRPPVMRREDRAQRPFRSAAGRRWHHEQKCVARPPTTTRRTGRPQRGHGSPVRW